MCKRYLLLASLLVATGARVFAQAGSGADFMRSMGKMYVVVAVIVAIFVGILIFLIYLDRKIKKLENQIKHNE